MTKYSKCLYNPNISLDEGVVDALKTKFRNLKNRFLNRNQAPQNNTQSSSLKSKLGIAAAGLGAGVAAGLLRKKFSARPQPKVTTTERVVDFSELPPDIQARFANKQ